MLRLKRRRAALERARAKAAFNERVLKDPDGEPVRNNWHHLEWLELMELHPFILHEAAREHAKTELAVTGNILFEIGANPNVRILLISDVHQKSKSRCQLLREYIERSEEYRAEFPDVGIARKEGDEWFTVRRGAKVKEATLTSTYAGAPISGGRWDIILCDDLVNLLKNSLTPEQREKVRKWFYRDVMNSVAKGGRLGVFGTPQHDDDLHAALEEDDRFHVVKYPAVDTEEDGYGNLGYRGKNEARGVFGPDADCLWPTMHDRASHEAKKRNDPDIYAQQQQLQSVPPGGLVYPRPLTDAAFERGKDVEYDPDAPQFLGLDPGYGQRAALLAVQEKAGDRIEMWREYSFSQKDDDDIAKVVCEHSREHRVEMIFVDAEDPGLASAIARDLKAAGLKTRVKPVPFAKWKRLSIKATRWLLRVGRVSWKAADTIVYRPSGASSEPSIFRKEIRGYGLKPGTDDEAIKGDDHGPDAWTAYAAKWVKHWLRATNQEGGE